MSEALPGWCWSPSWVMEAKETGAPVQSLPQQGMDAVPVCCGACATNLVMAQGPHCTWWQQGDLRGVMGVPPQREQTGPLVDEVKEAIPVLFG